MSELKIKDDTKIQGNLRPKAVTRLYPHHHTSICEIYISRSNKEAFKAATQMEPLKQSQSFHIQKESIYDFCPKGNTPVKMSNIENHQKRQIISRIRPAIQRKSVKPKAKQSLISSRRSLGLSRVMNTGFSAKDPQQISKHIQNEASSGNYAKNSLFNQASPAKKSSKFHHFDMTTALPTCQEVDPNDTAANHREEQNKSRAHKDQSHTIKNKDKLIITACHLKRKPRQNFAQSLPGQTLRLVDPSSAKVSKVTKTLKDNESLHKDSPSSKMLPESEMRMGLENPIVKDGPTTVNYPSSNILNDENSLSHIFDQGYLFEPNESETKDFVSKNQQNIKKAIGCHNIRPRTSMRNKKCISNERQNLMRVNSLLQDGDIKSQPQNFKLLSTNNVRLISDDVLKQKYQVDTSENFKKPLLLPDEHISKSLKPRSIAPRLEITATKSITSIPTAEKTREIGSFMSKTSTCNVKKANIHHKIDEMITSLNTDLITKPFEKKNSLIRNDGKIISPPVNHLQEPTNFELLNELVVSKVPENQTDQKYRKRNKRQEDTDLGSKKKCRNNTMAHKDSLTKKVTSNDESPEVENSQKSHEIKSKMNEYDLLSIERPMVSAQFDKQQNKQSLNSEGSQVERRESKIRDDSLSDFSNNLQLNRTRSIVGSNQGKILSPNILLNFHRESCSEEAFVTSKDKAANQRQKSDPDINHDYFLQQKLSDTLSKKQNTTKIVSSHTPKIFSKERNSNLKNISSQNELVPIQTPNDSQSLAFKDKLSAEHNITQNPCKNLRLSSTKSINLKPIIRNKYRRTRVTQNGSPIGGKDIELDHIKNLGINISSLEDHQQPKKNLVCQACESSALFGPKRSILKRMKAGPSFPEAASTGLVLHKTSDDINYTNVNNHQVISQKILRDPFCIEGSSCGKSSSIKSSPDPISKNLIDSTKIKSRLHKVSINPGSRQCIQDNRLSPCKQENKKITQNTQHISLVCSAEEEKIARDRWNLALRPHYQGVYDAVRRIVDEIIIRLVQEEDSMSLLVNQYKENGGKIIDKLSSDHTRERDSITRCTYSKIDEILRAQSAAKVTFLEHTERIKKSALNTIEENWEKRQDEIQVAISEGRISSI